MLTAMERSPTRSPGASQAPRRPADQEGVPRDPGEVRGAQEAPAERARRRPARPCTTSTSPSQPGPRAGPPDRRAAPQGRCPLLFRRAGPSAGPELAERPAEGPRCLARLRRLRRGGPRGLAGPGGHRHGLTAVGGVAGPLPRHPRHPPRLQPGAARRSSSATSPRSTSTSTRTGPSTACSTASGGSPEPGPLGRHLPVQGARALRLQGRPPLLRPRGPGQADAREPAACPGPAGVVGSSGSSARRGAASRPWPARGCSRPCAAARSGSAQWPQAVLRPGPDPLESLVVALAHPGFRPELGPPERAAQGDADGQGGPPPRPPSPCPAPPALPPTGGPSS